jgi:hypothetical protein
MKKIFTFFLALFSLVTLMAQENIIRNGDFESGLTDSSKLMYLNDWYMDKASPGSGWWGDANNKFVTLSSDDSATLYQVVETISGDSVLYVLSFWSADSWNTGKAVVIASVSEADTSVRTVYKTDSLLIGDGNLTFSFGFSTNSPFAGKKLIIEFTTTPANTADGGSWTNFDNVSLVKRIPGVNNPPVADAGLAQSAVGGTLVTLDGSGSSDPDSDPIMYYWISTFPGITLSDPNIVNPTFMAPDVTELSSYTFALYVSDGEFMSDTVLTSVTVIPKGELIRNGDFQDKVEGSDPASTSLKDIANWNIDAAAGDLGGGIWGPMVTLASYDPPFYQVVKTIGAAETTYSLSFSARSSWNAQTIKSIFSVTESDSTVRTEIDSKESNLDIDPDNGINTTDFKTFKHVFSMPANSEYVGKRLVLEFDNIAFDDGNDDGWCEIEFASLVFEETPTGVKPELPGIISVYPNPARDVLYIQTEARVSEVKFYSMLGKLEKTVNQYNIEQVKVDDLASGLYIIDIKTDKGMIHRKVQIR